MLVRIAVDPGQANGLQVRSQIMVDKATTIPRAKAGRVIGRIDDVTMTNVGRALASFLGLS